MTLSEIEALADALPAAEQLQLLLFLAARLRAQNGHMPPSREFTAEQIKSWIAEDESDMQHVRNSNSK